MNHVNSSVGIGSSTGINRWDNKRSIDRNDSWIIYDVMMEYFYQISGKSMVLIIMDRKLLDGLDGYKLD